MKRNIMSFCLWLVSVSASIAAQRMVVCEEFTSTTCPPCATAGPALTQIAQKYLKNMALVRYHMNWPSPGNDPYYAANSTENTARRTYYNVNAIPHMVIDGDTLTYSQAHDYTYWDGLIAARMAVSAPIELNFVTTYDSSARTGTVTWTARATQAISQTNLKLRMAITESDLWYTGTNGDPVHHEVMRDMVVDANGDTLTLVNAGDSITRTKSFAINSAWEAQNCQIVLWIQTDNWSGRTRQMLQGAKECLGSKLVLKAASSSLGGKVVYQYLPGDMVNLAITVQNQGGAGVGAHCQISTSSPYINITNGLWNIGNIGLGDTASNTSTPFTFSIAPSTPNGHRTPIIITKNITNATTGFSSSTLDTMWIIVGTPTVLFSDNFENGYGNWTRGGSGGTVNWDTTGLQYHSPSRCMTDSRVGNYASNISRYFQLASGINLTQYPAALLSWWERYSTEEGYDFCKPMISPNGSTWYNAIPPYSGSNTTWTKRTVDITPYIGTAFNVRFLITSDGSVEADGWYVDDVAIEVYQNTGVSGDQPTTSIAQTMLLPINPNPSAGPVRISYKLASPNTVTLNIYDASGRLVRMIERGDKAAGRHSVTWDGRDNHGKLAANGVYLYHLTAGNYSATGKLTIVR